MGLVFCSHLFLIIGIMGGRWNRVGAFLDVDFVYFCILMIRYETFCHDNLYIYNLLRPPSSTPISLPSLPPFPPLHSLASLSQISSINLKPLRTPSIPLANIIIIQTSAISLRRYAYLGIGVWSYGIVVYVVVVFDLTNIDIDIEGLGYIY